MSDGFEQFVELIASYKPVPLDLVKVHERFIKSLELKEAGLSLAERRLACLDSILRDAEG